MRKIKYLSVAVFIIAISAINLPAKSIAKTIRYSEENNISSTATNKPNESTNIEKTNDEKFLIYPKYNCDPKILIPGDPNIDPKFVLNESP